MIRTRTRGAFFVVMLTASAACSLVVDTSGLSGGAGAVPVDAPSGSDAPNNEAGTDGPPTSDTGPDSSSPCGPKEVCEDFEGTGTLKWEAVPSTNGKVVVDGVRPHSGAKSLHVSKTGTAIERAVMRANIPAGIEISGCSFDAYLDLKKEVGLLELFMHNFLPSAGDTSFAFYQTLSLNVATNNSRVSEYRYAGTGSFDQIPATVVDGHNGQWMRITTSVDRDALELSVNGGIVLTKALKFRPAVHGNEQLFFGMNFEDATGNEWEIFVDDIRCTIR